MANRNENPNEHANPFLKPAQALAEATIEGAKGLPGALLVSMPDCELRWCILNGKLFYRSLRLDSTRRIKCILRVISPDTLSRRTGGTSTRPDYFLSHEILLY